MAKNAFLTLVVSIFQKSTLENSEVGIFRFNFLKFWWSGNGSKFIVKVWNFGALYVKPYIRSEKN